MYHGLERKEILRCRHGCRGVGNALLLYLISLVCQFQRLGVSVHKDAAGFHP